MAACEYCHQPIVGALNPLRKLHAECRPLRDAERRNPKPTPKRHRPYKRMENAPVVIELESGKTAVSSLRETNKQMGRMKAGVKVQALGTGHRWTSESAKAARAAREAKRGKDMGTYRLGQRFVNRSYVKRQPLREKYSLTPVHGVQYSPALKVWTVTDEFGTRCISEVTALRKLGHLAKETDSLKPRKILKIVRNNARTSE